MNGRGEVPLSKSHPEIALEADGWSTDGVSAGSNRRLAWQCPINPHHKYIEIVANRVKGRNCPYCSNHKVCVGDNDMAATHPELAAEANGWDPREFIAGTAKKLSWRCSLDSSHVWDATGNSRASGGSGCPYCSGRFVIQGINDLATLFPSIAAEADGWDPSQVKGGSGKVMVWRCATNPNHRWSARISSRTGGLKAGCPYCRNLLVVRGETDLKTRFPDIATQAFGWDPSEVLPGSHAKMQWQCPRQPDHLWSASIVNRTKGRGCPICANRVVKVGFNDLASTFPDIALDADGWDASSVVFGSNRKVPWLCQECSFKWTAPIIWRTGPDKTGCPSCASHGYNPNAEAWLYLMSHELWGLVQVGITNDPSGRISRHKSRGWDLVDIRGPMPGDVARAWELSILKTLKSRKVKLGPEDIAGRFDGYTESWIQEEFPAHSIRKLMNLVESLESLHS